MIRFGQLIADRYEVIKELGRSETNIVYLVSDCKTSEMLAMKVAQSNLDGYNSLLKKEAEILEALNSPIVPRFHSYLEVSGKDFLLMEYVEGENLAEILDEKGLVRPETALVWMIQVCELLSYLHSFRPKIIYRDLKPANIILSRQGIIKIIDFGAARFSSVGKSNDTTYLGTANYAAPEQFGGLGQTDCRTDIYNLGITLRHLVYGETAIYKGLENSEISNSLRIIIEKAISDNPENRFQSAFELEVSMRRCLYEYQKKSTESKRLVFTRMMTVCLILIAFLTSLIITGLL